MYCDRREKVPCAARRNFYRNGTSAYDGVGGPATRRAILAFQKDHGLVEDARPTVALAEKIKAVLQAEDAEAALLTVHPGDMLVYDDGVVEFVSAERPMGRGRSAQPGGTPHGTIRLAHPATGDSV